MLDPWPDCIPETGFESTQHRVQGYENTVQAIPAITGFLDTCGPALKTFYPVYFINFHFGHSDRCSKLVSLHFVLGNEEEAS